MPSPSPLPVDPQDLWIQGIGPGVYVAGPDSPGGSSTGVPTACPASGSAPSSSCPQLFPASGSFPTSGPFASLPGLSPSPATLAHRSRALRVQQSRRALPEATARPCLHGSRGGGSGQGGLSPPPAPRGPAPRRWSLCARGPPGPRTGRSRSRSSGCGRGSRYPTPRRSPSPTCPRKRRFPGRTRSVWKVDGARGRLVTVRPGTPTSGAHPARPPGAPLPAGCLTPIPVFKSLGDGHWTLLVPVHR